MGKKSQPSPPPAPDPFEIARADAEFNRINQFTPFGSLTFSGPNRNVANLTLTPELQNLFNLQTQSDTNLLNSALQAEGGINQLISNPLSTEGLPELRGLDLSGLPGLPQDFNAYRSDVEKAFFDRASGLLSEQFGRDEERLRQTLANQGLQSGGEAFGSEFGQFNQRRGETFENLARDAVLFGGQEASRQLSDLLGIRRQGFGEAQQGFLNDASIRNQLFGERGAVRGNQFNELASLLGLQQVQQPGLQNFFAPSQANVTDAFGLNQAALQNNFNTQSQAASAAKGATSELIGQIASAGIAASDRRLKSSINRIGQYKGFPIYSWIWNNAAENLGLKGIGIGVIAQEVDPGAVMEINGYLAVDYGAL